MELESHDRDINHEHWINHPTIQPRPAPKRINFCNRRPAQALSKYLPQAKDHHNSESAFQNHSNRRNVQTSVRRLFESQLRRFCPNPSTPPVSKSTQLRTGIQPSSSKWRLRRSLLSRLQKHDQGGAEETG